MLKSIEGIYRNGQIEFVELPPEVQDETPVIVTFLVPPSLDLQTRGIDEAHAAALRARLATFVEDWDSPEMDVYNAYNAPQAPV